MLYCRATVGMNIGTMICILVPSLSPAYHVILAVPNVALMNAMACRVFRQVRLGLLINYPSSTVSGTQQSTAVPLSPLFRRGVESGPPKDAVRSMGSEADISVIEFVKSPGLREM